jgi:preprotein translocase subunit SecE
MDRPEGGEEVATFLAVVFTVAFIILVAWVLSQVLGR